MSSSPISRSDLQTTLDTHSLSKYYIEYNRFLSNHVSHAAIALYHLGDNPEHYHAYVAKYIERLEAPNGPSFAQQGDVQDVKDWKELIGKRKGYYQILAYYEARLKNEFDGDLDKFLGVVMEDLLLGSFAAALHPLIQTGYGYSVKHAQTVLEGVAYMHHSNYSFKFDHGKVPPMKQFGKGTKTVLEVFGLLEKDDALFDSMRRTPKPMSLSNFQNNMYVLMVGHANTFAEYAYQIKLPTDVQTPEQILYWALDQAITLYVASSRRNDFFFIHAVTASWALTQFFHILSPSTQTKMLQSLVCTVLALYLVQGRPSLNLEQLSTETESWNEIRKRVLALDVAKTDEHIFKLVQVCYVLDGCPAAKEKELYKRAAMTAMDHPLIIKGVPGIEN